ncbi:hypothetical protein Ciccas_000308 [Cichlidogyrus casuarinus]|uniref:BZIP domain-containing protein n=1 Tax=Cichlidogyrus casuarinus TaxID=1844966 RepID=A0ABD2QNC7_9PLAT
MNTKFPKKFTKACFKRDGKRRSCSVAALTAKQYREHKKLELQLLKEELERCTIQLEHYKSLYESARRALSQITPKSVQADSYLMTDLVYRHRAPNTLQISCEPEEEAPVSCEVSDSSVSLANTPSYDFSSPSPDLGELSWNQLDYFSPEHPFLSDIIC